MFGLTRGCRNFLRFSSILKSTRLISSTPQLLNTLRAPSIRQFSTNKPPPSEQIKISKIQLIAPLRKPNRRRRPLATLHKDEENSLPKVVGMAKAESYDLCAVFEDEHFGSFYQVTFVDDDTEDALHIVQRSQYRISETIKDAFLFNDGVLVAWNMNEEEQNHLTDFLQPFEINAYDANLVQQEQESMSFTYGPSSRIYIKDDIINLANTDNENAPEHVDVLNRFAISHAMAASIKIGVWEQELNDYAGPLYETTKFLSKGNIPWTRKESIQKTGQFAALRQSINLDSGLLNTDFYWERDEYEKFYDMTKRYFVVDKRLKTLNNRLESCEQSVSIIDNMLTHRHSSRLEWLIIWLIVIEVIFDFLEYFECTPSRLKKEK
ncbi:DUF155 domain-containing protein [Aphelenchoides bicaudatus]|nr:DUF155 domain-containing protein [Aphelenchoides bicaudatus]